MKIVKTEFINYWKDFPKAFVPIEIATFTIKANNVHRRLFYLIVMNIGICVRFQAYKVEGDKCIKFEYNNKNK